jgi:predicted DNA-binding transcriptional regulator YafY
MSKPTSRVLAALELLQSRQRVTGAELAERLQVDRRTVRRYIATLIEIGVPISAERGRDGAYKLKPGFKLPPMMFTDDEALAVSVGLVAARGLGLANTSIAVASALAKLERVMPDALRLRVRAIDRSVRLDLRRPPALPDSHALSTLSEATQQQRSVRMAYRTRQQADTERLFDPYGLAFYLGHWYTVGHCHLRRGLRSFRLDRVQTVQPVNASFGLPADFDPLAYLREAMIRMPRAHSVQVLLHTDLEGARRRLFAEIGLLQALPGQPAPRVLLNSEVDDLAWFARELARLPFDFEIRKPAALARVLAAHGLRLAALAREGTSARPVCAGNPAQR